jgi:NADPH-dependent curcumin reductase CurA
LAEFQKKMGAWVRDGRIVWEKTITEGIENASKAFLELFGGDKMGKALVKV